MSCAEMRTVWKIKVRVKNTSSISFGDTFPSMEGLERKTDIAF